MDDFSGFASAIFSFVVITFLFSTLIVPQLNKLKDIRDKIREIGFPDGAMDWGSADENSSHAQQAKREKLRHEGQKLENYFLDYEIKANHLRYFVWLFYFAFGGGIIWFNIIGYKAPVKVILFNITLFVIMVIALRVYKVPIASLKRLDWLAKNVGYNPHNLWGSLRAGFYWSNSETPGEITTSNRVAFILSPDTYLTGWRYYLQVVDNKDREKVYFISFGPIKENKKVWRNYGSEGGVTYHLPLGSLPTNLNGLNDEREVRVTLFVFAPVYKNETRHPFVADDFRNFPEGEVPTFWYSGSYMSGREDDRISFKGKEATA